MICHYFVICLIIVHGYAELAKVTANLVVESAEIYYQLRVPDQAKVEVPLEELPYLMGAHDIKVIIHGMKQSREYMRATIANSYASKHYAHVLLVDWSSASSLKLKEACSIVKSLAKELATKLNNFMRKHNIDRSELHLIGCGLGANIASAIGELFGGRLGRITGLNPTKPVYPVQQLTHKAAVFVDIIHTDCLYDNDCEALGHADFYPNFAKSPQPGCDRDPFPSKCNENRATIYFAESIDRPRSFPVFKCGPRFILADITTVYSECAAATSTYMGMDGTKDPGQLYMGEKCLSNAKGVFYVITNARPPYGRAPKL